MKMKPTPLILCLMLSLLPALTVCQTVTVGGPDDTSTERSITPTLGNMIQLFCSRPSWAKDWYTTGTKVAAKDGEINTIPGLNKKLEFVNFKTSQVGTYSCILEPESDRSNTALYETFTVTLVNIQNTVKVGMNSETILTIRPDESEPVKLECERTSKNRNWYSDGIIVTPTNGQLTTADMTGVATLSISTLNANNAGKYTCKVTDGGTTEYIIVLVNTRTVRVGMNRSELTLLNVTPDVNEPVKLECEWTGQDKFWYNDRTEVSPTSGQLNITEEGGILTLSISTFNENYTGSYTCIITDATNYTVVLSTSTSTISPTPPPQPSQVQGVTVTRGVSDGSPSLRVSWIAESGSGITYTVRYSTNSGTTTEPPSGASTVSGITGTSTTLSGLTRGTVYYIWVATVSSGGKGPYSTRVSETTFEDLESINMSGSSSSISSQTLGAGIFGGVVVGLLIGTVISCVTTKIVWGAPNLKRCQKRSEQSKLRKSTDEDYEAPDIALDTNPSYDTVNTYEKVGESSK